MFPPPLAAVFVISSITEGIAENVREKRAKVAKNVR
jgi:hypothetical protein